ncbi:MAG: preprotein translocase subunit SecG [Verrucomicrobia bacterium]|nr:preprotein translocase subunit SecG [Verrucomicrobiota bacterium]
MAILGTFLLIIHILVGLLMCIVILMQSSKGEGLSGAFGMGQGTSTFFGADTANVLVKITTVLAVIFMVTSLSLAYVQAYKARSVAGGQPKAEMGPLPGSEATGEDESVVPDDEATPGEVETPGEDTGETPGEGSSPDTTTTPEGVSEVEGGAAEEGSSAIDDAGETIAPPIDTETPPNTDS